MRLPNPNPGPDRRAAVLIIVLWVAFGLVSIALYFAHATSLAMRTADNRAAAVQADQAILGALRYATGMLANSESPGRLPDAWTYRYEAVPVGEAHFWFLGPSDLQVSPDRPIFGLRDEAALLNLNTATVEMLRYLPRMTDAVAGAIVDWRDTDSEVSEYGGAEEETYSRLARPYRCKNGPFESIEELRLVQGVTTELLYGEDANLNGVLDPNENDGELTAPSDNRDGRLDPGLLSLLTLHSRDSALDSTGTNRIDLASATTQDLTTVFQEHLGTERANQVLRLLGNVTNGFSSVLELVVRSGLTGDESQEIEDRVWVSGANQGRGLVNINTADEAVLACIPGIGITNAATVVARRRSNPTDTTSVAWIAEVLDQTAALAAGPHITGRTSQFTLDIAALGHHARGFRRLRFVCDLADGSPVILARRDLTDLGWALGPDVRTALLTASTRR